MVASDPIFADPRLARVYDAFDSLAVRLAAAGVEVVGRRRLVGHAGGVRDAPGVGRVELQRAWPGPDSTCPIATAGA